MDDNCPLETHPFPPFIPDGAKILICGTFPPKSNRWSMEFYYPNRINDFWRIMGLIFHNDKDYSYDASAKTFRLDDIKRFLDEKKIALSDTGHAVRRLKDNASDKFLEIVEPLDLYALLDRMPDCVAIATTGEKAAEVMANLTSTEAPAIGECVTAALPSGHSVSIFRMPSTSRAYPLSIEKKARYYSDMFHRIGIL